MSLAADIIKNWEMLKTERLQHDSIIQEVIDYIAPFYMDVQRSRTAGQRRMDKIVDSTALYGSFILSQFIQGSVCNPATTWCGLKHRDDATNEKQPVADCLDQWTRQLLQALRQCNFYQGNGQAINSWINMANAPLLCEMVPQKRQGLQQLRYTSIPFGSYVWCEGEDGKIDTFIYSWKITARDAVRMFQKDQYGNNGVSPAIEEAAKPNKEPYRKFEFLHCIQPREVAEYSKSKIRTAKEMLWSSCWVEVDKKHLVRESGYRKWPVAIARYDLVAGEVYARGPSEMALPDVRTLNQATTKELLMWDRTLDPPTVTKFNNVIGGVLDKRAGGDTAVRDVSGVQEIFSRGANFQFDDLMRKRAQESILRVYHVNEILNLLAREKPEMTAFEVNARLSLLQQIQGPVFGRLEQDYLSTIVDVSLDNMAVARMLTEPPDELRMAGGPIDVVYEGPLARAQRNNEIVNIQQAVADITGLASLDPEVPVMFDAKKAARKLFSIRGQDELMLSEEDLAEKLKELMAQKQAQQQAAMLMGAAEAGGKIAPLLKVASDREARGAT